MAFERVRAAHPGLARRYLRRASKDVRKADELRAVAFLNLLGYGLEVDVDFQFPPSEMVRILAAAIQVTKASLGLWKRLDAMLKQVEAISAELAEHDARPRLTIPPASRRRFLVYRLRSAAVRILAFLKRRQRSKAAAPEDAPRRVSRGRAPPSPALCPL